MLSAITLPAAYLGTLAFRASTSARNRAISLLRSSISPMLGTLPGLHGIVMCPLWVLQQLFRRNAVPKVVFPLVLIVGAGVFGPGVIREHDLGQHRGHRIAAERNLDVVENDPAHAGNRSAAR